MTESNYKKSLRHIIEGTIDLIAGSAGGCANVIVGQPLDTVKVKMQTFPNLYPNTFKCFTQTLQKDGWRHGLYAGTVPALAANVAENSVLFCAYGFCQQFVLYLKPNDQKVNSTIGKTRSLTVLDNALAGFFAAFFSSFTLCPTELIKCKLQALRETGHSSITSHGLIKEILRNEGFKGMFRGLSSTMMREMPGYFFFFGSYELSKNMLRSSEDEENLGLIKTIFCGGIGGLGLWVSIFPFDVVKSRIQVNSSKERMLKVLFQIIRNEGVGALYKGLVPTVLRTFPSTGALFVCYENSKYYMTKLLENQL